MKFSKIGALIGLLAIVLFSPAVAEWTGATADQYISYLPDRDKIYCPALAVGPNFELYAVWAQEPQLFAYEIYFSKSIDGGITWSGTSADQMISANDGDGVYNGGIYGARRVDIAVNSLGYIYVVWPEYYITAAFDTTQEIMMVMSTDGGNTWIHSDTDFPISDTASIDNERIESTNTPNIAIDFNDNIHVIWNQKLPLGYPDNFEITSGVVFNDSLYIGTQNSINGGEVWKTRNTAGTYWDQVNTNGFEDANNIRISSMMVFNGMLYVGTENTFTGGEVWGSSDGRNWSQVNIDGFGDSNNIGIKSLAVLGSSLYAGTQNSITGGEIWRSPDGTNWSQVNSDGFEDINNIGIASLVLFGSYLYAGTQNNITGGEIWRSSDGTSWSQTNSDGFGDSNNLTVMPKTVFSGMLYAGTANSVTGGEIWRSSDGASWSQANSNGFGSSNNIEAILGGILRDSLYAGTQNNTTGGEVWVSGNGTTWNQVNRYAYDGPYNVRVTPQVVFNNYLYHLTANNTSCGEIWKANDSDSWSRVFDVAEIYYSKSSDLGTTWTGRAADRMVSNNNRVSSFYSDIDVGPDNKIHLVWLEYYASTDQRVQYGVSADAGVAFSSENSDSVISVGSHTSSLYFPRIKAKPFAGHVHVVYCQNDTATYVGTTDGGVTWHETEIWGGSSYDMYGPDIAVTTTGTMVAILDEQHPGTTNRQIFASYSFDYGLTWSVALDPVSNYDPSWSYDRTYIPSVLITNTDVLHCLYSTNYPEETGNSYQEMAYSRSDSLGILRGAIGGIVTELDGTTPIDSVMVVVYDSDEQEVDEVITNINGVYYFALEPATYSLSFSKYTHHDSSAADIVVESNVLSTVNISLRPVIQGKISGNVYEETGTYPLQFVAVEAADQSEVVWASDTTDADGFYELTLWPGTYDVSLSVNLFHDTTVADVVVTDDGSVDLDVNMTWAIPADDIGPISIEEPYDFMLIGQAYTPKITVENYGYQDQIFDLKLTITDESDAEVYNETISGASVDSLSSAQFTFSVDFEPIFPEDYTLTAMTVNEGDESAGNDTYVTVITAYQHQGYGGPDGYGYTYRDNTAPCGPEFNWIDISGTGTTINPEEHYFMSDELPLGFSMEYYGSTYSTMFVNSHGSLHLGIESSFLQTNDCPLPDPSTPIAPMVLPFWDSKIVNWEDGQGVYFEYFDDPSVDYTIVQWNVSNLGQHDTLEFEVILYEDGRILLQYNKVNPNRPDGQGQEATVGLEYDVPPELYGLSYLCDDDNPGNRLFDGLAIEWVKDTDLPGSITGVVTDASTSNPIEGVFVEAIGMGLSDITNAAGEYTLPDLYACDYSVSFSHAEYNDTTVTGVVVNPDAATTLNVEMQGPQYGLAYLPGDVNMANGAWPPQVIGGDVTYLVNYFRGLPTSSPCLLESFWCSADANGDCSVIGSDVTKLVNYFRGQTTISFCADHEPLWLTPDDLPEEAPSGWPNCE